MDIEILNEGKSFYYINKEKDFPPDSTTYPADYVGQQNLSLWITQLSLKSKEQAKVINDWVDLIPKLDKLKYLWFQSKVSQKIFDAVCENVNIESLYIKWSGIKNIENIQKLKNLKYLHIGSSTQIESLDILAKIKGLEILEIENTKLIGDYNFLSALTNLKGLGLTGSMWTTLKINSLLPVKGLTGLTFLDLGNTKIVDLNFEPLLNLKKLRTIIIPLWYSRGVYKQLYDNLPNLKYGEIERIVTDDEFCKEYKIK